MARAGTLSLLAALAFFACARAGNPGFPPPARPGILVPTSASGTFYALLTLLETRGYSVLMADTAFGILRTDWMEWQPGENDLRNLADCGVDSTALASRTRARFGFEVRPRANRAFVTILAHWQMELHAGFDDSDRGFVDCRSTGEWERTVEEALLQRQLIRR